MKILGRPNYMTTIFENVHHTPELRCAFFSSGRTLLNLVDMDVFIYYITKAFISVYRTQDSVITIAIQGFSEN